MMRFRPLPLSPQQRGVMLALVAVGCGGLTAALVKWHSDNYSSMQFVLGLYQITQVCVTG
jgi:hypothetical protein